MGELKSVDGLFEGRHFDREVIILCVRWYLRFKLSLRDLVEMMAERGLSIAHTTIIRWAARRTRVRETLATVCPVSRPLMARR
jgi:transposase-like protein